MKNKLIVTLVALLSATQIGFSGPVSDVVENVDLNQPSLFDQVSFGVGSIYRTDGNDTFGGYVSASLDFSQDDEFKVGVEYSYLDEHTEDESLSSYSLYMTGDLPFPWQYDRDTNSAVAGWKLRLYFTGGVGAFDTADEDLTFGYFAEVGLRYKVLDSLSVNVGYRYTGVPNFSDQSNDEWSEFRGGLSFRF